MPCHRQDLIKTRAQTSPAGTFKGPLDIATQTIRKEGVLALYKGVSPPLLGVAGVNSLLFASNAAARQHSPFHILRMGASPFRPDEATVTPEWRGL